MCSIITSFTAAGVLQHMPLVLKPDSQNWFGLQRLDCFLRVAHWGMAGLSTHCLLSSLKWKGNLASLSPVHLLGKEFPGKKKRKYISSSLSINFPCNYTWLKSSAKEGPGKRELGLSLEKQLNYVQCGARSYIKKAILQRVQQAMREIRIWDLTKTRKKECLFRYPMLSKPGQEAYKECH